MSPRARSGTPVPDKTWRDRRHHSTAARHLQRPERRRITFPTGPPAWDASGPYDHQVQRQAPHQPRTRAVKQTTRCTTASSPSAGSKRENGQAASSYTGNRYLLSDERIEHGAVSRASPTGGYRSEGQGGTPGVLRGRADDSTAGSAPTLATHSEAVTTSPTHTVDTHGLRENAQHQMTAAESHKFQRTQGRTPKAFQSSNWRQIIYKHWHRGDQPRRQDAATPCSEVNVKLKREPTWAVRTSYEISTQPSTCVTCYAPQAGCSHWDRFRWSKTGETIARAPDHGNAGPVPAPTVDSN